MKTTALCLLVASGLVAAVPQQPTGSSTVIPLPTVGPPPVGTSRSKSISLVGPLEIPTEPKTTGVHLTVQTSSQAHTTATSTSKPSSSAPPTKTGTGSPPTNTVPAASSQSMPGVSSASTPAGSPSASASHNAAPMQFGPWKEQGIAALGAITAVFASMLFML
ncbi:hypothetical protein FRC10_008312 [Ceratobasidium sp. 414]|nr:hypothetical protein FRC10_008312 [Ceratobasidium sp. 414]